MIPSPGSQAIRPLPRGERWDRACSDMLVTASAGTTAYPPEFSLIPRRTSSTSEDDTEGTCSPSDDLATATRVLLKTVSAPAGFSAWAADLSASPADLSARSAVRLLSNSAISTEYCPAESSATLPGVAEVRTSALSDALIGARPWEKARKRRS